MAVIREEAIKIWKEQADQLFPRDLLEKVLTLLDEFRSCPQ
jgi:hypothetical protein